MRVEVHDDPAAVAAGLLVEAARAGAHIALSGGSTPADAYAQAAASLTDWSAATLWFGDDRAVPPLHEHSNFRMVDEALLSRLTALPAVHRVRGELGAEAAADEYDGLVREAPPLGLALMGLGPDGHTASLFPGKPEVDETGRAAVAVPEPGLEPLVPRVTMTLPVFNAAARVVFLVAGAGKAEAVRRAFGDVPDLSAPAARVRPASGDLLLLCDPAAAAGL